MIEGAGKVARLKMAGLLAIAVGLAACGEREVILPGERLDVRSALPEEAVAEDAATDDEAGTEASAVVETAEAALVTAGVNPVAISLPGQVGNAEWTHRGGTSGHRLGHAALGQGLTRVWTADAGQGESRKNRIAADPVVGAGRIYTLDATASVMATGTNGAALWRADLTPTADRTGEAGGGGLAYGGGLVFATTGYGELVALDAATGAVAWRQKFDTGVGGAPTVEGDTVYVVARDASAWAIRAGDGKVLWQLPGTPAKAGVTGVSAPAVAGPLVVFPFASGQMIAADRETAAPVWQAYVAGARIGRAYARVSDLTGDPVVADGVVYAGTSAGRLAAVSAETGERLWSAPEGAMGPVQVAGGQVFFVNDENQLMRVDAATGEAVWRIDLPYFLKDRAQRRRGVFVHYGPVLAGGRLWTASSDGYLRAFDPTSGAVTGAAEIPGGAASAPAVAGGTLYVMSRSGQLHAFR